MSTAAKPRLPAFPSSAEALVERADMLRLDTTRRLEPTRQAEMGQFLTPAPIARFMASLFEARGPSVRLLDAGAGIGSLTAAWIAEMCGRQARPREIAVVAYEVD